MIILKIYIILLSTFIFLLLRKDIIRIIKKGKFIYIILLTLGIIITIYSIVFGNNIWKNIYDQIFCYYTCIVVFPILLTTLYYCKEVDI